MITKTSSQQNAFLHDSCGTKFNSMAEPKMAVKVDLLMLTVLIRCLRVIRSRGYFTAKVFTLLSSSRLQMRVVIDGDDDVGGLKGWGVLLASRNHHAEGRQLMLKSNSGWSTRAAHAAMCRTIVLHIASVP